MIKPIENYILIEPRQEKNMGGIIVAKAKEDLPEIGTIISVGSKVKNAKPGEMYVFKKYGADEITIDGKKHLFITEDNLIALYDEATTIQK